MQNKNINWLTRGFFQFIVLPTLMILGVLASVVMILLAPLILLVGLGAFKLWMRRVNKQVRTWQKTQTRYVKSYTVETVNHPDQPDIPRGLPAQDKEISK